MKYIKLYKKLLMISVSLIFILIFFLNNFLKGRDDLSIFQNCAYEKIENIPQNSIIVIGHVYGSPLNATKEDYLPNKVTNFLNQNKDKIETLILTGDIFWQPSKKKWDKLLSIRQKVNIAIEEKRSSKIIGASLEADIEIDLPKTEFDILREVDAQELFIVSKSKQNISKEKEDILVKVKKAEGTKCSRCWKIVVEVKDNKCSRCLKIK